MADLAPYWTGMDGGIRLYHARCLDVMASLADCSVDAVVTDPPYNLSDSGKRDFDCLRRGQLPDTMLTTPRPE
jgi:DNA modification methylase